MKILLELSKKSSGLLENSILGTFRYTPSIVTFTPNKDNLLANISENPYFCMIFLKTQSISRSK